MLEDLIVNLPPMHRVPKHRRIRWKSEVRSPGGSCRRECCNLWLWGQSSSIGKPVFRLLSLPPWQSWGQSRWKWRCMRPVSSHRLPPDRSEWSPANHGHMQNRWNMLKTSESNDSTLKIFDFGNVRYTKNYIPTVIVLMNCSYLDLILWIAII